MKTVFVLFAVLMIGVTPALAQDVRQSLAACATSGGPLEQLECYDAIGIPPFLTRDGLGQSAARCATIDDGLDRLVCYHGLTPGNRLMDLVHYQSEQSELSYAAYRHNSPKTILEARIAPHLFLNEYSGRWALEVTPKVRMRIFKADSSPVRSPSFMPRVTLYFVADREWRREDNEAGTFLSARISHHSNGQDGDFFNADGSINSVDGSFSTNFAELGLHRLFFPSWGWVDGIAVASLSFESHLWFNQSPELEGIYSERRLNARFDYLHPGNVLKEIDFDLVLMLDKVEGWSGFDSRRANWEVTVRFAPPTLQGATFFTKLYWGQDYYNMRFNDRVRLLQVGLNVDFFTWAPVN